MNSFVARTLGTVIDTSSHANNLPPSLDVVTNIVPEKLTATSDSPSAPPMAKEEVILKIPGAIIHLIDKSFSVQLACGDLEILRTVQGAITVAVFVANDIQWPLTKDQPAVKLDESHYFFSDSSNHEEDTLSYGLTIASKGQNLLLEKLDRILTDYSSFTVEKKAENNVLDLTAAKETTPEELKGERKTMVEEQCTAYWTTLAPNVKDYIRATPKLIPAFLAHAADKIQSPLTKAEPPKLIGAVFHHVAHPLTKAEPPKFIGAVFDRVTDVIESPLSKVEPPKLIGAVFDRVTDVVESPLTIIEPPKLIGEVFDRVTDVIESPLTNVKSAEEDIMNFGKTMASKVQEPLLENLDRISKKKAVVEEQCMAHWTTLAPNAKDYNGEAAKLIASGSGKLIKGILWCGDVTIDGLMWGNDFMKRRLTKAEKERQVSSATLECLKRMKKMTKMMEKVVTSILSGIIKVFIFFLSLVVNSEAGKTLFGLPLGEIVLATLDGFNKVFDAVEIAGRNVMKTSSTVTTEIVDYKYGAKTAQATNEGLGAAGHALGTAWTVFKIIQALNLKSAMKSSSLPMGDLEIQGFYERLGAIWHALGMAWTIFNIFQALNPKTPVNPLSLAKILTENLETPGFLPLKTSISAPGWLKA